MDGPKKIVCIGGSMRPKSRSAETLDLIAKACAVYGLECEVHYTRDLDLPNFNPEGPLDKKLTQIFDEISECAGLVVSAPIYHLALSGSVKNILDYLGSSNRLRIRRTGGVPAAAVAVMGARQDSWSANSLVTCLRAAGARVTRGPLVLVDSDFDADGNVFDPVAQDRLAALPVEILEDADNIRAAVDAR